MAEETSTFLGLAVFCPQTNAPQPEYLDKLRDYIHSNCHLQKLVREALCLCDTWDVLAKHRQDIAVLQGRKHLDALTDWLNHGPSTPVASDVSGILCMPLLVLVEISQYFQFLENRGLSHSDVLANLQQGKGAGVQGYCAGLLPALAVATAKDEESVIINAAKAMRLGLAIGAYAGLGDDMAIEGNTTIVVRLRNLAQAREITEEFPGTYIGAITDPRTIGIVGPVATLRQVAKYIQAEGVMSQSIHLRGKNHNPENAILATDLCQLLDKLESLQLGNSDQLLVRVDSNWEGKPLGPHHNLSHEAVFSMLTSTARWDLILRNAAESLRSSPTCPHLVALFGIGDPVSLAPFHQARVRVTKLEMSRIPGPWRSNNNSSNSNGNGAKQFVLSNDASVAVIGTACHLPGANSLENLWDLFVAPDAVLLDQGRNPRLFSQAHDLPPFDPSPFHLTTEEEEFIASSPQQRVLLELAFQALDSSGYFASRSHPRGRQRDRQRVGCFISTNGSSTTHNSSMGRESFSYSLGLSNHFNLAGPSETMVDTGLVAVHRAYRAVVEGVCEIAIAGDVVLLEGSGDADLSAGLVVLKNYRRAVEDGDLFLGVVVGSATNYHKPEMVSELRERSWEHLYSKMLDRAGMKAAEVSYIEANSHRTPIDSIARASIRRIFVEQDNAAGRGGFALHIGSLKHSPVGHGEAAVGTLGLIKVLAMLKRGQIPPAVNPRKTNSTLLQVPETDGIPLPGEPKAWDVPFRAACVSSFVDAGRNAALVCCEAPPVTTPPKASPGERIRIMARWGRVPILISAVTKPSLVSYCRKLESYLQREAVGIGQLAYTLATRRKHHRFRWSAIVSSTHELRQSLGRVGGDDMTEAPPQSRTVKRVVLAFGGQNQRFVGLDKAVYDCSPRFQYHLNACDEELRRLGFPSLLPSIFSREPVSDIVLLQAGTFAVQYASSCCWIDGGLQVDAVIGHSFGELTALTISGAVSLQAGLTIVAYRAMLIASKWGPERGTMLAVHSTWEAISSLVVEDVEVACYNAERSVVLVGPSEAMTRLEHELSHDPKYAGIRYQRLDVSHGFHSKLTEPLLDDFRAITRTISFQQPDIPLETCTLDPCSPQSLGSVYLANHMRKPVYFAHAVQRIERRFGPCIWLEAGLDSSIISMVRRAVTMPKSDHIFQPVSSSCKQDRGNEIPSVAATLWKAGCAVSFWPFLSAEEAGFSSVWTPPYSFDREGALIEKVDLPASAVSVGIASPGPIQRLYELLRRSESSLPAIAERQGLQNYRKEVAPRQDAVALAYVLKCFKELHVDFGLLQPGNPIPPIDYLPRHAKLVNRMMQILQKHDIIESRIGQVSSNTVRGTEICPTKPLDQLVDEFTDDFPCYKSESRLLSITASNLASYLIGKQDLLFSSHKSQKILQDFYAQSPLLTTVAEFLGGMMGRYLAEGKQTGTVQLLEVGARFGTFTGTLLRASGCRGPKIEYTFTDPSPALVNRASRVFGGGEDVKMDFKVLNVESQPPKDLIGHYDLVISASCVHTPRDKSLAMRNMTSFLKPRGFVVLTEMTEAMDWYDLLRYSLNGWLPSGGNQPYPLQSPETWVQDFGEAGFRCIFSQKSI